MSDDTIRYDFETPVPIDLDLLDGTIVSVSAHGATVKDGVLQLTVTLPFDDWDRADAIGSFHTDLDEGSLAEGLATPVDLELMLRPGIASQFADGDQAVAALLEDDGALIHQSEAWLLVSATQVMDDTEIEASVGFRTLWAEPFS